MRKVFGIFVLLNIIFCINASEINIYQTYYIGTITITGNFRTKSEIILRELTFVHNQKIDKSEIAFHIKKSRENLLNTTLFNFVTIDTSSNNVDSIFFTIDVQERWYIWPNPILEMADRNLSVWLKEKNWYRTNYGLELSWKNFSGRNDDLKIKTRLGYKEQYALSYNNPNINIKKTIGINVGFNMYKLKETAFKTENDEPIYYNSQTDYINKIFNLSVNLTWRPYLYSRHNLIFEETQNIVSDTIIKLNPEYFGIPESEILYFSLTYSFKFDKRDSKAYPLEGYYTNFTINKIGLGINKNTINELNSKLAFLYYKPLFSKLYFGNGSMAKITANNKSPYFLNKALGYNDIIIGYDYYVIDGQNYFVTKNNLKYELISTHKGELFFPKYPQFNKYYYALYLNLNYDIGYVKSSDNSPSNMLTNTFLYGGGIGIDWVSYYDIVFRIEYSINKFGQTGIFFHYESPFFRW